MFGTQVIFSGFDANSSEVLLDVLYILFSDPKNHNLALLSNMISELFSIFAYTADTISELQLLLHIH